MTDFLNDPSMKEIIDDFCNESFKLFSQLEDTLESLEDNPSDSSKLEQFGQIIDRIMGAARSISATEIATFCELGKVIGYKSSQTNDEPLLKVVVAVLFDAVDILKTMIEQMQNRQSKALQSLSTDAFISRLKWLSEKFKDIERSSCGYEEKKELTQSSIDDLMSSLGL